ncbi:Rhs-family protein [Snodgrassella alvi wkB2]|nr:Rhs-family protein [Snodgrassella alvi wkB2]
MVSKKHSKHGQTDYRYDHTGRIEGCRNQRYWETLQYDAAANLLDSKYREDYSNHNLIRCNQLLHFRGHHYRYDEHGRTASKQTIGTTQHYHYDAEHRLSEVRIEQTGRSQRYGYVYDALGRRIEKHRLDREGKPCNRTTFLWDGLQMIQESGADKRQSLYLYTDEGSYEPLARIDRNGNQEQHIYYFHTDLNGLPEELTDEAGEIVWECSYQLWGKPIQEIAHTEIQQNLRYQGQYLDRETGLHYNTFRYYDPDTGRFTKPDPIGLNGGFNLYQYAPNGLTWIDPFGLSCGSASGKYQPNNVLGRKVYKNTLDINPGTPKTVHPSVHPSIKSKVNEGWTNLDLMKNGYAPIGPDGKQMNLHHILGKEPGPMVELVSSTHKQYHKQIHGLIENGGSFRNTSALDRQYNKFRKEYWKLRALDFM